MTDTRIPYPLFILIVLGVVLGIILKSPIILWFIMGILLGMILERYLLRGNHE